MTTNRSYGTWNSRVEGYSLTVDQSVGDALNGEYTDEQIEAVTDAYRAAINAALPDSVSLCGDEFYGHARDADCADQADYPHDEDGRLDINAIVESVDFWGIVEKTVEPVDAETLAGLIAERLGTIPGPLRNGCYSIDTSDTADATGVWRLHVGDDPSPDAPNGISWAIDSPEERGVASGGWEQLPGHLAAAEAATLAASLTRQAAAQALADSEVTY